MRWAPVLPSLADEVDPVNVAADGLVREIEAHKAHGLFHGIEVQ